jgi:hypothetical protein
MCGTIVEERLTFAGSGLHLSFDGRLHLFFDGSADRLER